MNTLKNKLIIYDGNCGLCVNSKERLSKWGIIPEEKCLNYYELDQEKTAKVDMEHFRYEMALVDEGQGRTLYGLEGILFIFSTLIPLLGRIKTDSRLFKVIQFFYHTISFNRYFLFPRKRLFKCDCDPPFVRKFFLSWMVISALIAIVMSGLLGLAVADHIGLSSWQAVGKTLLVVGSGWLIQIVMAAVLQGRENFSDYMRHIGLIMTVGVLILVPSLILFWLPSQLYLPLLGLNVVASSLIMLRMHWRRIDFMQLKQTWTWSWFLALQASALFWIVTFKPW